MLDVQFWLLQFLHGLQFSMLLFLLSVGLTVIFGLLHFVNLAHGALYMLGAYFAVSLSTWFGSFWWALVLAPIGVTLVGAALYFGLIRHMRNAGHMNQVLVTFGLVFVTVDLVRMFWGEVALGVDAPEILQGATSFLGITYPKYRLFIIVLGILMMIGMVFILERTKIGMMIRASVENETMASAMGIPVTKIFVAVFCIGSGLAGLGGVAAAPLLSANTGMAVSMLIPTMIVVVIGGLGSLYGAIVAALLMGFVISMGAAILPNISAMLPYIILAGVLILHPQGLIPIRGRIGE